MTYDIRLEAHLGAAARDLASAKDMLARSVRLAEHNAPLAKLAEEYAVAVGQLHSRVARTYDRVRAMRPHPPAPF